MNISKLLSSLFFVLFIHSSFPLFSQNTEPFSDTTQSVFEFVTDDFIAASLDSLANLKYFEGFECATAEEIKNIFGFEPGYVPVYADSVYYNRLKKLRVGSSIEFTYNQYVRDYIEMYAIKKRGHMQRVMGLAQIYFPMFEEHLDRFDMPLELKYLAIVESALNPMAKSRVGATGLWQFMYGTGKAYNLNVTSLVDDRRDPLKSTIAACEHMRDLYKIYDDWFLVLAAYNSGAGNVNKAIRRSGGKRDFWQIRPFLPLETRGYVPAFIAVNYVMSYAAEHNLRPIQPLYHHYEIDTVLVKDVLSFNQISTMLNIPDEELAFLNPTFKAGIIPATNESPYALRLQKKSIPDFVNNEAQLYALRAKSEKEKEEILALTKTVSQAEYHKVKKGENLGLIANKYKCSVNDLKRWNHLKKTNIQIGQRLIVRPEQVFEVPMAKKTNPKPVVEQNNAMATAKPEKLKPEILASIPESNLPMENPTDTSAQKTEKVLVKIENVYHKVRPGESLGLLADKYNTSISKLRVWNNISGSNIRSGANLIVGKREVEVRQPVLAEASPLSTPARKNDFVYYTIQQGDTLWKIAQKHQGVSVEDIKKLNNISDSHKIRPGQRIKVQPVS
ncbi:MAG: LysM peptidoglycan-binding domain-containing protein [Lentimicrobium sp.]|nr:LysM peptidoglycan-binding domain-containing protein [Lentimicrobium sp.]